MYYNNYSYKNRVPSYSKLICNLQTKFDEARKQLGDKTLDFDFYIRRAMSATLYRPYDEITCKNVLLSAFNYCHIYKISNLKKTLKKYIKKQPKNNALKQALDKLNNLPKTHVVKYNKKGMLNVPYVYGYADKHGVRPINYLDVEKLYNYVIKSYDPSYRYIDMSKVGAPTSDEYLHEVKITVDNQPCYLEINGK